MWIRRTFHDYATELESISDQFRSAYLRTNELSEEQRQDQLKSCSQRGVEALRALALAIRSEQDWGLVPATAHTVGALKNDATDEDIDTMLSSYEAPYCKIAGYQPLTVREGLNKIAHADLTRAGFFADNYHHDLLLSGLNVQRTAKWVAVLSLIDLCSVVKALPDRSLLPT